MALRLMEWMPSPATVLSDLNVVPEVETTANCTWNGIPMQYCGNTPFDQSLRLSHRIVATKWCIPLTATVLYLLAIVVLKIYINRRGNVDIKSFAFGWNVGLSLFSWAGVFFCVPVLINTLRTQGLYFTTCAPSDWYCQGWCGLFILFFILSKLGELVDTMLLILSGKPVILLHWWHHATVMLYCWHSYSVRISTGVWFAAMNYFVHSIMYGYFAATQTSFRRKVFSIAMYITLLQLVQMLIGMWITVKAVTYQIEGRECHVNKTNSLLGLTMYFSYFVLFGELFVANYLMGKRAKGKAVDKVIADVKKE